MDHPPGIFIYFPNQYDHHCVFYGIHRVQFGKVQVGTVVQVQEQGEQTRLGVHPEQRVECVAVPSEDVHLVGEGPPRRHARGCGHPQGRLHGRGRVQGPATHLRGKNTNHCTEERDQRNQQFVQNHQNPQPLYFFRRWFQCTRRVLLVCKF